MRPGDKLAIKCFHPVRIERNGQVRYVRCGKCVYCRVLRSMDLNQSVIMECITSKSVYFVTLTYAKEFIPRMVVRNNNLFDKCMYDCFDCSTRYDIKSYRDENDDFYLGSFVMREPDLLRMHDKLNTNPSDQYPEGVFPYLYPRDFQLFLKRFRKYATNYNVSKLRYFCLGEYSPKRFRPHWHILFFFEQELPSKVCEWILSKSWRYGRYSADIVQGKAVDYVTSYSTGSQFVSPLHEMATVRPRFFHSLGFGGKFLDRLSSRLEFSDFQETELPERVSLVYAGKPKEFRVIRQMENRCYPRCVGYSEKSRRMRRVSYLLYDSAQEYFKEQNGDYCPSLFDLASFLVDSFNYPSQLPSCLFDVATFYSRCNSRCIIYRTPQFASALIKYYSPEYREIISKIIKSRRYSDLPKSVLDLGVKLDSLRVRDSLYRELLTSRKLIRMWKSSGIKSIDIYLDHLYDYYDKKELQTMNVMLSRLEECSKDSDAFAFSYYDNIFEPDKFDMIPEYNGYVSYITDLVLKNRKHRELNEANDQFCYSIVEVQNRNYSRSYSYLY